jgi:hypothetical protein
VQRQVSSCFWLLGATSANQDQHKRNSGPYTACVLWTEVRGRTTTSALVGGLPGKTQVSRASQVFRGSALRNSKGWVLQAGGHRELRRKGKQHI